MRLNRKSSLLLSATVLILFFVISINIVGSKKTNNKEIKTLSSKPEVILKNFQRSKVHKGKKLWEVTAERGRYLTKEHKSFLTNPNLKLFKENGDEINLIAKETELEIKGNDLKYAKLKGDVKLIIKDKLSLNTDEAFFYGKENKVKSNSKIEIKDQLFDIKGDSLIADLNIDEYQIIGNVKTKIKNDN